MPRNIQRFGRLLRDLRNAGGNTGTNGRLAGFKSWLEGGRSINVENQISGEARERVIVSIAPFYAAVGATDQPENRVSVYMTKYAFAGWDGRLKTHVSANELGWKAPEAANRSAKEEDFYPAILSCKMTRQGAVENKNKISGITGDTYAYTPSRTFNLPFGRTITSTKDGKTGAAITALQDVDWVEVTGMLRKKLIEAKIENLKTISFKPEVKRTAAGKGDAFDDALTVTGVSVN